MSLLLWLGVAVVGLTAIYPRLRRRTVAIERFAVDTGALDAFDGSNRAPSNARAESTDRRGARAVALANTTPSTELLSSEAIRLDLDDIATETKDLPIIKPVNALDSRGAPDDDRTSITHADVPKEGVAAAIGVHGTQDESAPVEVPVPVSRDPLAGVDLSDALPVLRDGQEPLQKRRFSLWPFGRKKRDEAESVSELAVASGEPPSDEQPAVVGEQRTFDQTYPIGNPPELSSPQPGPITPGGLGAALSTIDQIAVEESAPVADGSGAPAAAERAEANQPVHEEPVAEPAADAGSARDVEKLPYGLDEAEFQRLSQDAQQAADAKAALEAEYAKAAASAHAQAGMLEEWSTEEKADHAAARWAADFVGKVDAYVAPDQRAGIVDVLPEYGDEGRQLLARIVDEDPLFADRARELLTQLSDTAA